MTIPEDVAAEIREALAQVDHGLAVDLGSFAQYADDNPAYRHGGPDAGWYLRTMLGWRRISDTEAARERYLDMRHFMHDPNEDDDG